MSEGLHFEWAPTKAQTRATSVSTVESAPAPSVALCISSACAVAVATCSACADANPAYAAHDVAFTSAQAGPSPLAELCLPADEAGPALEVEISTVEISSLSDKSCSMAEKPTPLAAVQEGADSQADGGADWSSFRVSSPGGSPRACRVGMSDGGPTASCRVQEQSTLPPDVALQDGGRSTSFAEVSGEFSPRHALERSKRKSSAEL